MDNVKPFHEHTWSSQSRSGEDFDADCARRARCDRTKKRMRSDENADATGRPAPHSQDLSQKLLRLSAKTLKTFAQNP